MRNKITKFFIFFIIGFICLYIFYQLFGWDLATKKYKSQIESTLHSSLDEPFKAGEKIAYTLRYLGLPAGKVVIRVEEMKRYKDRPVYHLLAWGRTSDFVSLFFEIEGSLHSYMDVDRLHSLYFKEESQARGHRKNKKEVFYNQKDLYLTIEGEKIRILPDTQDPLSALYLIRLLDIDKLKEGYEINIKSRKRDRFLYVQLKGREELKTPFGRIKTIKLYFHLKPVKATTRHEVSGTIWFTDNKKRIPILVKADTKAGPASILLYDIQL